MNVTQTFCFCFAASKRTCLPAWLGDWLVTQQKAHTKGTLDAARRKQLEALGVVWKTKSIQEHHLP